MSSSNGTGNGLSNGNGKGEAAIARHQIRRLEKHLIFPLAALETVADIKDYLNEVELAAVVRARELGATWDDIAIALRCSRQTVFARYKAHEDPEDHRLYGDPTVSQ